MFILILPNLFLSQFLSEGLQLANYYAIILFHFLFPGFLSRISLSLAIRIWFCNHAEMCSRFHIYPLWCCSAVFLAHGAFGKLWTVTLPWSVGIHFPKCIVFIFWVSKDDFCLFGGPYPVRVRAYSWFCFLGSLLVGFKFPLRVPKIKSMFEIVF